MADILIIFDIDGTIINPGQYYNSTQVGKSIYDPMLLAKYLSDSKYQVSLASFNGIDHYSRWNNLSTIPFCGPLLAREILEEVCKRCNLNIESNSVVPNNFLQCWKYATFPELVKYGKNKHIRLLISEFYKRWNKNPSKVIFYDDDINNIYLANKIEGVDGLWVQNGLTNNTIDSCIVIGKRVKLYLEGLHIYQIPEYIKYIRPYQIEDCNYVLYLPNRFTQVFLRDFLKKMRGIGVITSVLAIE